MYPVLINDDWIDYGWLREGCIDEMHFNWFYSLWTANNPDIRKLLEKGQFRKFVGQEGEYLIDNGDMVTHSKRFALHNVDTRFHVRMGENTLYLL